MSKRGDGQPRTDPALGWVVEMIALLADAEAAAGSGDLALTKHRLALLALCWCRRPTGFPPRPKRSG